MITPDRIYIEVLNGGITPRWAPNREDKTDVEYIRADIHDAEIDVLKAENTALHAECDRLLAMLGSQKVLSAEEVTGPGFYWWRINKYSEWKLFEVDYSVRLPGPIPPLRRYHGDDEFIAPLDGQFIGPLNMPGV